LGCWNGLAEETLSTTSNFYKGKLSALAGTVDQLAPAFIQAI
jgi:hypothetical protein